MQVSGEEAPRQGNRQGKDPEIPICLVCQRSLCIWHGGDGVVGVGRVKSPRRGRQRGRGRSRADCLGTPQALGFTWSEMAIWGGCGQREKGCSLTSTVLALNKCSMVSFGAGSDISSCQHYIGLERNCKGPLRNGSWAPLGPASVCPHPCFLVYSAPGQVGKFA